MNYPIVKSSQLAVELGAKKTIHRNAVYPFDSLEVGDSFTVDKEENKLGSLRAVASRKSKDGKVFIVVIHTMPAVIEVARTA